MAEVEPDLEDFREESGASRNFPDRGGHFEDRVKSDNCICGENVSAYTNWDLGALNVSLVAEKLK